jgi:hypothetical protein
MRLTSGRKWEFNKKRCQAFSEERGIIPQQCIYFSEPADSKQCIFCDGSIKKYMDIFTLDKSDNRGGKREGAGRKPSGKKKRNVYVTDQEHEEIKKLIELIRADLIGRKRNDY